MARTSNSFTVQVVAAPTSALGTAAINLTSGQWGFVDTIGMNAALIYGGGDHIMSYCRNAQWDSINGRIQFYGVSHEGAQTKHIRYQVGTGTDNNWTIDQLSAPEPDGTVSHGFHHFAIRPSDAQQFIRRYDSNLVATRVPGGSWSNMTGFPGTAFFDWNVANALIWHGGRPSGGRLVFCGTRSVYEWTGSAWASLGTSGTPYGGSEYGNVAAFNRSDNCVYFGGQSNGFARVNTNGTVVQLASAPGAFGTAGADGQGGLFGGGAGGVFMAVNSVPHTIYEYNVGTNVWNAVSQLPFNAFEDVWFSCSIPAPYGVVAFIYTSSGGNPEPRMHIWKR